MGAGQGRPSFCCIMTDVIGLFDGKGQATQYRFEKVGIANEPEVGKVYAVDSSFVVETYHAVGS